MAKPVIWAVDDDPDVLRAVERDLRRQYGNRYRVMAADSGASALAAVEQLKLRNETVALFLVDQRMPRMSGVEFLEQALKLYPDAKRALLTAYADTDAAIRAINSVKIDHYLMKPWDPPEERLYGIVDDLLDDWQASYRPVFEGMLSGDSRNSLGRDRCLGSDRRLERLFRGGADSPPPQVIATANHRAQFSPAAPYWFERCRGSKSGSKHVVPGAEKHYAFGALGLVWRHLTVTGPTAGFFDEQVQRLVY